MGTKHTPGPWETSINGDGEWDVCGADAGDMIADLSACDNAEANARLIAAAPDLLAALADVEMRACQDSMASGIGRKSAKDTVRFLLGALERIQTAARAAVTKATGGA